MACSLIAAKSPAKRSPSFPGCDGDLRLDQPMVASDCAAFFWSEGSLYPDFPAYYSLVTGGTPPSPLSIGIIELDGNSRKIFGFKGLIGKIFRNKDLRDPFASLRISAAGSRFAHAR